MKRDTYYLGMRNGSVRRERASSSKSFVSAKSQATESERVQSNLGSSRSSGLGLGPGRR